MIHLFGASGYIGSYLRKNLTKSLPIKGYYGSRPFPGGVHFNLLEHDLRSLSIQKGDQAIILSAKPQIDYCKNNPELSRLLNVEKTKSLLSFLNKCEIFSIFISSDNVYPGTTGKYDETSLGLPVNEYGRQKQEVENFILKYIKNHCILRIPKIIGFNEGRPDFLEWLYEKLIRRDSIQLIKDQSFQILGLEDLTKVIKKSLGEIIKGIYNVASIEKTNRLDLLLRLASQAEIENFSYETLPIDQFRFSDKRATDSTMVLNRFQERFNISLSSLDDIIKTFLENYKFSNKNN